MVSRKQVILGGITAVALAGGAYAYTRVSAPTQQTAAPQEQQVTRGNIQLSVTASGSLTPPSNRSADLSFRSSGVVEEVNVQVGDNVKQGQQLARLELRPLQLSVQQAEISLRTAQINYQALVAAARPEDVTTAQASLEAARQKLANMESQGQPEDVTSAQASVVSAQTKLDLLTNPSNSDVLSAQAAVDSARANLLSAQQKANTLRNPLPADIAAASSSVDSARQKLDALRNPTAADIASAQAAVSSARASYNNNQTSLDNLKNPPADTIASAKASVSSAQASVQTAQNSLASLKSTLTTDKRRQLIDAYIAMFQQRDLVASLKQVNAPDEKVAAAQLELTRQLQVIDTLEKDANLPNAGTTAQQLMAADANISTAQSNLESATLKLQKLITPSASDLATGENAVASSKAALDSALAKLNTLTNPSPADLQVAQSAFDAANAKYQQLLNPTQDDLKNADAAVNTANANLATSQAKLDQLRNPSSSDVAGANASLVQAQNNLIKAQTPYKEADLASQRSAVASAEASLLKTTQPGTAQDLAKAQLSIDKSKLDLDTAQLNLDQATLTSPIDGIVSKVSINPGASQGVGASTVVMSIIDPSSMQVTVNVDESDIAKVDLKQNVVITVEAAGQRPYRGTVTAVAPSSTVQSGVTSYAVTIAVADARGLKAGMTANANIVYQSKQGVLLVPNRAIKTANRESTVQVLVDGQPQTRTIKTGIADDQRTEVIEGLNEGDTVLVEASRTGSTTANRTNTGFVPGAGGIGGVGGVGGIGGGAVRPAGR